MSMEHCIVYMNMYQGQNFDAVLYMYNVKFEEEAFLLLGGVFFR